MSVVGEDHIVEDFNLSIITGPHTSFSILANVVILLNSCVIFLTFDSYTIFEILFYPIIPNDSIGSQTIFSGDMNTIFPILSNLIHENIGVCADRVDSLSAFSNFAQLNLSVRPSLYLNSRTFNMRNIAS